MTGLECPDVIGEGADPNPVITSFGSPNTRCRRGLHQLDVRRKIGAPITGSEIQPPDGRPSGVTPTECKA